ncbi:hypothetical protein K9M42_02340 [Patescibacteria group bacterium]|nr:hypothetical protein [Patescibacteria group bacterium]
MNYTGISDKKLEKSLWFLKNKKKIRFVIYSVVFIMADIFWSLFISNFIFFLASVNSGGFENLYSNYLNSISKNYINFSSYITEITPSELKVLEIDYINTYSSYKTDIYAEIKNENSLYRVSNLDYYFTWDGGRSETQSTFIEKGETKYLFSLGNEVSGVSNLEFVVDSINYDANLNDDGLFPSGNKRSTDLNVDTSDFSIKAVSSIKVLNYAVENKSIYDYDNLVVYPVIFNSNNKPIFIYRNNIGELKFEESKKYSINLPLNISDISKIGVFPELNLYVEDNYIY